ncbi:Calpain-type cysteine protease dek1 [Chytriomyces hyalinus]|nr:Calpain-type cysteine protease dek1 [Chytriomyces hyalinus]
MDCPSHVDPSIWAQLPVEIQLELASEQVNAPVRPAAKPSLGFGVRALRLAQPPQRVTDSDCDWRFSSPAMSDLCKIPINESDPLTLWTDPDFKPDVSSIDGIKNASASQSKQSFPSCNCPTKPRSRLKIVSKENKNHGRHFFTCAAGMPPKGCSFFMWAPDNGAYALQHSAKDSAIEWKRLTPEDGYSLTHASTCEGSAVYSAMHVNQGSVGDCWLISAMAVLAEQPDLIERVLDPRQTDSERCGFYNVRLFIDGKWRVYRVDNYFALQDPASVKKQKQIVNAFNAPIFQTKAMSHGPQLHFAKSTYKQLWVPVLEKAYAKAHSSYKSISGGQIAEALFDLTGFPTESIHFGASGFDSNDFWTRLMSFDSLGFLMGAACPISGNGLVGGHAYSILRVVEENCFEGEGLTIGREKTLFDYSFETNSKRKFNELDDFGVTEHGTLRLVKLRNPWGKVEWKGKFGVDSVEWSPSLRKRLQETCSPGADEGGTFWMSYHDFLQRFMQVDVCFTHKSHHILNIECVMPEMESVTCQCIELLVPDPTWVSISLCQRTKRGKASENFYYTDLSLLILALHEDAPPTIQDVRLFGQGRDSHFDLFLGEQRDDGGTSRYLVVAFSVERETALQEARLQNGRGGGGRLNRVGSGGRGPDGLLKRIEFTVRLLSANAVGSCERDFSKEQLGFVWDAVERSICDMTLVGRKGACGTARMTLEEPLWNPFQLQESSSNIPKLPSPSSAEWKAENHVLRITQSFGIAVAHVTNTSPNIWIRMRLKMQAATKTYSTTMPLIWRVIPPLSRRIIGVAVCPSSEAICGHDVAGASEIEWDSIALDQSITKDVDE